MYSMVLHCLSIMLPSKGTVQIAVWEAYLSCMCLTWALWTRLFDMCASFLLLAQYVPNMTISLKHITWFTLCVDTDHTFPYDSIVTVDATDRRLDTYFTVEDINRKKLKANLEKIMCEEYTLDWSQSKVFLVYFLMALFLCMLQFHNFLLLSSIADVTFSTNCNNSSCVLAFLLCIEIVI